MGYADATDPSVFVRMPLVDKPGTSLLGWTTTPWTLPANVAVAVGAEVEYVTVERSLSDDAGGGTERLILAEALLEKVFRSEEVKVVERFKGKKLKGTKYHPLFTFMPLEKPAHYVILGEFVTTEDGTGLVHIAPAFGADDMEVSKKYDLPILLTVGPDGAFLPPIKPWRGVFVKDADPSIILDLQARRALSGPKRTRIPIPSAGAVAHRSCIMPVILVYPHQPVSEAPGGTQQPHQLGAGAYS